MPSFSQQSSFAQAVSAYERAIEIEGGRNGQTLADLGEAMLISEDPALIAQSSQLFEGAVKIAPDNQKVLFYAGMTALQRGENELAATRWERLLASSPPENIKEILRQQIAALRGEAPPAVESPPANDAVVTVSVSLGESATDAVPAAATVFIIARDPAQPSPPIAAVRRQVSELPADIAIGDSDAMIPGRVPSGFAQLEIVARVSMSGQPIAQSGDWFGQHVISIQESREVAVTIDQQVP
jgi:cytochrome c-type biogenesis protein CcmH